MQAQPSGRLSDSDVYAITHAESAAQASAPMGQGPPTTGVDTRAEQHLTATEKPGLLQLEDLATADAITPHHKAQSTMSRAAANSPLWPATNSTGRSSADAQGHQLPGLAQLRALAGVADSPQMLHQIENSANELSDVASVPLDQWQFGNTGTAHAVWQADSTPPRQSATGLSEPVSAQPLLGFTGAESAVGRAASPTWGPSEPPQPVHLEIKVLGDGDISDRSPASRAGSRAASVHDSPREHSLARKHTGVGSFGFEAGYGSQAGVPDADNQLLGTAAGDTAAAGMTSKAPVSEAATSSASMPMQTTAPGLASNCTAAGSAASESQQGVNPASGAHVHDAYPVGSAGADELAESAAQLAGSPWDPRQGPKLLESLSDFSSFNSSFSMLQQLAGKSAAGLATLGIGSSSSSSQRAPEKKKSDKGHLISSAPAAWWRRRPGSAKKNAATQVWTKSLWSSSAACLTMYPSASQCVHGCPSVYTTVPTVSAIKQWLTSDELFRRCPAAMHVHRCFI